MTIHSEPNACVPAVGARNLARHSRVQDVSSTTSPSGAQIAAGAPFSRAQLSTVVAMSADGLTVASIAGQLHWSVRLVREALLLARIESEAQTARRDRRDLLALVHEKLRNAQNNRRRIAARHREARARVEALTAELDAMRRELAQARSQAARSADRAAVCIRELAKRA